MPTKRSPRRDRVKSLVRSIVENFPDDEIKAVKPVKPLKPRKGKKPGCGSCTHCHSTLPEDAAIPDHAPDKLDETVDRLNAKLLEVYGADCPVRLVRDGEGFSCEIAGNTIPDCAKDCRYCKAIMIVLSLFKSGLFTPDNCKS
jgi:hypothetical protein